MSDVELFWMIDGWPTKIKVVEPDFICYLSLRMSRQLPIVQIEICWRYRHKQ